jgi:hypothetical protein
MRAYFLFKGIIVIIVGGYFAFTHFALQGRPLNESLAYDALVRELGESLTAGKEMIFMGEGTLSSSRQQRAAIPLIEKLKFRYIAIVSRHCAEWDANCYRANELELSAEKSALPMI